jgi:transcription initiation factor IIE alpha subunit
MSDFWEMYKKRVSEGANKLPSPPKEVDQHILWLKASATEKLEETIFKNKRTSMYVGSGETFAFKEEFVNYLLHYAYEAGKASREYDYNRATSDMRKSLDKIKEALDDIGFIDYGEY